MAISQPSYSEQLLKYSSSSLGTPANKDCTHSTAFSVINNWSKYCDIPSIFTWGTSFWFTAPYRIIFNNILVINSNCRKERWTIKILILVSSNIIGQCKTDPLNWWLVENCPLVFIGNAGARSMHHGSLLKQHLATLGGTLVGKHCFRDSAKGKAVI